MYKYKDIWHIAYPILISLVMQTIINITDTAYMGRVGEVELGAAALASVYYMAIFMAVFGFSIGAQVLIGRRNGEGRYDRIGGIVLQGIIFLLIIAALLIALSMWLSPLLLSSIVTSPRIFDKCMAYHDWRIWGLLFSAINVMGRAFYVGITRTRVLIWNSVIMTCANVVFNYILVFGAWGIPAMGIAGAALGSVLSEALASLHFFLYTVCCVDTERYGLRERLRLDVSIVKGILSLSVWTMLQNFLTHAVWFVFFLGIEHLGELPLAITNIVRGGSSLLFMPIIAFAATSSTLVSNALGAGRADDVPLVIRRVIGLSYGVTVPLLILIALFPSLLLMVFTNNAELIEASLTSLYVMLGFNLLAIPGCVLFHSVSGTGNTRFALFIEIAATLLYALMIYVIIFYWQADVAWCWSVEYIYWGVLLVCTLLYFKYSNWRERKV